MNTWKSQDLNPNLPTANAELILLVLSGSQSKGGYWILHVMIYMWWSNYFYDSNYFNEN